MEWSAKDTKYVLSEQGVELKEGLSGAEALKRLSKFGSNSLQSAKKINPVALFLGQFKDVLIIILMIAALVSWGVGLIANLCDCLLSVHVCSVLPVLPDLLVITRVTPPFIDSTEALTTNRVDVRRLYSE